MWRSVHPDDHDRRCTGPNLGVEDDPFTREGPRDLLDDHQFNVRVAATGSEGLEAIAKLVPELICLDVMMLSWQLALEKFSC
ncbi:MAG TPA: hypothetical protein DCR55_00550 [Lentisphaeria bacterium]|jgi:CheY-like chemotaxis protein|nr:hypothetical protein [Lentisphaeria bacterium]